MKIGDKVFVSKKLNHVWTGNAAVINIQKDGIHVDVKMIDGEMAGKVGGFPTDKLECPRLQIEGGTPHGFGVWVDGKFHPVDIGALGTIITELQDWKASALKLMEQVDLQRVADALGLKVGTDITTLAVLVEIDNLQTTNLFVRSDNKVLREKILKLETKIKEWSIQ